MREAYKKYAFLPAVSNCLTTYCHIRNANRSSDAQRLFFFCFFFPPGYSQDIQGDSINIRHRTSEKCRVVISYLGCIKFAVIYVMKITTICVRRDIALYHFKNLSPNHVELIFIVYYSISCRENNIKKNRIPRDVFLLVTTLKYFIHLELHKGREFGELIERISVDSNFACYKKYINPAYILRDL